MKKKNSMINPVSWHHELNLSGETKSFFSRAEDARVGQNERADAHFNTQTSHNMNLRKQMAFRPFL